MKLTGLRPMLWTRDLQATIDFYTNTLGFTLEEQNDDWGWASLHKDDVQIMVALPNEHTRFDKPAFTGTLYITTDHVDYWWEMLKDKVKISYPIETFEYDMREFGFYDNNGYLLQYGQPLESEE
jgi:catechol 2,3-dioxygenase-like lactoylglutathione lyase family enzyme